MVNKFEVDKRSDSTILTVSTRISKLSVADSSIHSAFFKIRDAAGNFFYPQSKTILVTQSPDQVNLRYALPPVTLPYFLYQLVLEGNGEEDKVIITLYKNFRSEG